MKMIHPSAVLRECLNKGPELVRMAERGIEISTEICRGCTTRPRSLCELAGELGTPRPDCGQKKLSCDSSENAPLVDFFSLMRDNITTEELPAIADETRRCYEWTRHLASCL